MKNQIYIFLLVLIVFTQCKNDSHTIEPDNIFYWKADNPKGFTRANSIIDYRSDVLSPISVIFDSEKLDQNKYQFSITLDGGDSLLFANDIICSSPLKINDVISDSIQFDEKIKILNVYKDNIICSPIDTFYIGFKRKYTANFKTTFGWFRVITPPNLKYYYIIDEMGWNYANHQPCRISDR